MDDQESIFIQQIKSDPDSDEARLIYIDWLLERGDTHGEYLQAEIEFANCEVDFDNSPGQQLQKLLNQIDLKWVEQAGIRFDCVLQERGSSLLNAVKHVKILSQLPLMKAKRLTEQKSPQTIVYQIPFHGILELHRSKWFPNFESRNTGKGDPIFVFQRSSSLQKGPYERRWKFPLVELDGDQAPTEFVNLYLTHRGNQPSNAVLVIQQILETDSEEAQRLVDDCPVLVMSNIPYHEQASLLKRIKSLSTDSELAFTFFPTPD